MTGTRTASIVRGRLPKAVYCAVVIATALSAPGDWPRAYTNGEREEQSSSPSISTDEDTANFTGGITGSNINVVRTILGLTIHGYAQMRFHGVTAFNHVGGSRRR